MTGVRDQTLAQAAAVLARVPPFRDLSKIDRARLAGSLEEVDFAAGEVIYQAGAEADALYILRAGSAERRSGDVALDTLEPNAVFGDTDLLSASPRATTVAALTDCSLWRLPGASFTGLVGRDARVASRLAAGLSGRIADLTTRLAAAQGGANSTPSPRGSAPAPRAAATASLLTRQRIGLISATLILVIGWLLPAPAGLSPAGWHALVTLIAAVPLLALESLPEGVVALGLAAVWVVGGVATPKVALSGYATGNWVLVVSMLVVGTVIASTGLLYRFALLAVSRAKGGYLSQVLALGIAGIIVSPTIPNATARVTLIAPAVAELVDALGYKRLSRAAAGLAMAVQAGFGQTVAMFLTGSTTALVVYAVLPEAARAEVSWLGWFIRALPTHIILMTGLLGAVAWLYRPHASDRIELATGTSPIALQREVLGPMTRPEWIALATTVGLVIGFLTQPLHGIDAPWLCVLSLAVLAATGILNAESLRAINWSFAILVGILTSMVEVFAAAGLDKWMADVATSLIGSLASSPVLFVAAFTLACYAISFVLRWQAAAPLLTIALSPLALSSGINPWVIGFIATLACNTFFLSYQSTVYLALFHGTGGRLFTHAQARPAAIAYGVITLVALCASVPVWQAMGLIRP